jgi:hypothetical protein
VRRSALLVSDDEFRMGPGGEGVKTDELVLARSREIAAELGYGSAGAARRPRVVAFTPEQIDACTASSRFDQVGFDPRECRDADEGRVDDYALARIGKKLAKRFIILFTADN